MILCLNLNHLRICDCSQKYDRHIFSWTLYRHFKSIWLKVDIFLIVTYQVNVQYVKLIWPLYFMFAWYSFFTDILILKTNWLSWIPQSLFVIMTSHIASHNADAFHYGDVIMGAMTSQITSLTIVYSTVYSGADQRKHPSSASLAIVRGIHWGPMNSPHKWPVTPKMFPFDDIIRSLTLSIM